MTEFSLDNDGRVAYEEAVKRVRMLNEAWQAARCPLLTEGSEGQDVPHPLIRMIAAAENLAIKLRMDLRKKHRGPDPSAVIAPRRSSRRRRSGARSFEP